MTHFKIKSLLSSTSGFWWEHLFHFNIGVYFHPLHFDSVKLDTSQKED